MATNYEGKCDNCGTNHPKMYVEIRSDRGDNVSSRQYWCLECIRGNK